MVLDSVTFAEDSPAGTAKSVTNHPIGQVVIKYCVITYYLLTFPFTWNHIQKVAKLVYEHPQKFPMLALYSADDPISDPKRITDLVAVWTSNSVKTRAKCWDRSAHVLHYKHHPEEYQAQIELFLEHDLKVFPSKKVSA